MNERLREPTVGVATEREERGREGEGGTCERKLRNRRILRKFHARIPSDDRARAKRREARKLKTWKEFMIRWMGLEWYYLQRECSRIWDEEREVASQNRPIHVEEEDTLLLWSEKERESTVGDGYRLMEYHCNEEKKIEKDVMSNHWFNLRRSKIILIYNALFTHLEHNRSPEL